MYRVDPSPWIMQRKPVSEPFAFPYYLGLACVSFARVRRKKDCPDCYIVVTFGLEHKAESPRIDIATEPYPNRWTHHVLISELEEIDDELMGWIREAAEFSDRK